MRNTPIAILLLITVGTLAAAQQPRSLDDELLEDLRADPVDEFDRELFGPADKQGGPGDPVGQEDEDLSGRLRRELGAAAVAEDDNPLLEVARQMREVEGRIAENDSGPATRELQEQIISDLELLIEQARKSCRQCQPGDSQSQQAASRRPIGSPPKQGSGGKQPSDKPATASSRRPDGNGQTRRPDMEQMRELLKQLWGELPPRERERMLQAPPEEFLPKYELLIEEYFRRLSEEKKR